MRWLLDTNILLRSVQVAHPMRVDVSRSVEILLARGEELNVITQNLIEFWAVASRPINENGLGLSTAEAARELRKIINPFIFLPSISDVFPRWENLVIKHKVIGKQAHDAHLVAAMLANGLTHLLSFNDRDFKRFTDITVVNPQNIT